VLATNTLPVTPINTANATRVCHLTSVHDPLDNRIFYYECVTLARAGYAVTLIAPSDANQLVDGVRIVAVPKSLRRLHRMTKTVWAVYRAAVREDATIYHLHDPELIPAGLLLRLRGKRVIYDVHEDVAKDMLTKRWIPRMLRRPTAWLAGGVTRLAGSSFAMIIAATQSIAHTFPTSKTVIIHNYPPLEDLRSADAVKQSKRPNHIAYVGSISKNRGIMEMVDAMSTPTLPDDAKLILAGAFDDASLEFAMRGCPGWSRVEFRGWRPREELKTLLSSVKVGLVLFHPEPNHVESMPAKLFDYMAAGIPVIASDFPLWRSIIEEHRCGMLVDPLDVHAVGERIDYILRHPDQAEDMGQRGRRAAVMQYNWDTQAERLLTAYGRRA
jgi:glycosyltransferase involved in cell wall biosynthesis